MNYFPTLLYFYVPTFHITSTCYACWYIRQCRGCPISFTARDESSGLLSIRSMFLNQFSFLIYLPSTPMFVKRKCSTLYTYSILPSLTLEICIMHSGNERKLKTSEMTLLFKKKCRYLLVFQKGTVRCASDLWVMLCLR